MVILIYVGQFYEVVDPLGALLLWGTAATMKNVRYLFMFSWNLYIVAYVVPMLVDFAQSAPGAVTRTYLFTIADVLSKIVYGILLGKIATIRSAAEGCVMEDEPTRTAEAR